MSSILDQRILPGAAALWRRRKALFRDDGSPGDARSGRAVAVELSLSAGIALLGVFWGCAVAVAETNALYLCVALIGCAFILLDFRVGVVLLVLLMPISSSTVFPHQMLGITGLNPVNLLLVGTLGTYLLHGVSDGSLRRFAPRPLLWLYIVPILVAGALGSRHVNDIAPAFFMYDQLEFHDAAGYARDLMVKPMSLVIFALLVGAAVSKSEKPEKFLVPTLISTWAMCAIVIVFVSQSGVALSQLASDDSREFLSPLGLHANDLGRLYAVAYALLLFTWAESKDTGLRFALLASMGMVVVALALTFSRGAFLGFVVVNVLFLLWRRNAKALMFFGLLAAVVVFLLPGAVYDRVESGFGSGLDAVSAGRIEGIWLPLLPDVLRSPIYGNGLGSILWSDAMRAGVGVSILGVAQAHNAYLETVLDMGIVGLIFVCAYFVHVLKEFRALSLDPVLSPTLRGFYQGAAAGTASFLVAGIAGGYLTPRPEQIFLWLAIGMMYGQRARKTGDLNASRQYAQAGVHAQSA
jgi:O-antigen ligase